MIRYLAIIENTFREGIAKKTILILFGLISAVIFFFLLALGATTDALFLFGQEVSELPEEAIRNVEAVALGVFYQFSLFLGIFAIAAFFPNMQEKGTIDLLLSRPMSRFNIFSAKFIGCMVIVLAIVTYMIGGTWLVIWFKTGIHHIEYLYTIPIFMLMFVSIMSFMAMVGIITRNTTSSAILAIFFPVAFAGMFFGFHISNVIKGSKFWYPIFESFYWILPKTPELTAWNVSLVAGEALDFNFDPLSAVWTTVAFSVVCYLIGAYVFHKRSY
jgi:ABC-type transport system involved in multi-copper enzyme maturation permease subunit